MTPEEPEDYQEAIRRIKKAEENKSTELDLSGLQYLIRFPPELASLTSLQSLNLAGCTQLSGDLASLASLTSLQSLDLSDCKQLRGDLPSPAGLTLLQSLNLSGCTGIRQFTSLEPLLARLKELYLYRCRFDDFHPRFTDNSGDKTSSAKSARYFTGRVERRLFLRLPRSVRPS